MIKYYCDKCGKQIESYNIFTIKIKPCSEIAELDMIDEEKFIVCPKCASEITKPLEGDK